AAEIATTVRSGKPITPDILKNADVHEEAFPNRTVTAWYKDKAYVLATAAEAPNGQTLATVAMPKSGEEGVASMAIDKSGPSLRAAKQLTIGPDKLEVVSSVPLDQSLLAKVAESIGVVSMEPFRRTDKSAAKQNNGGKKLTISGSNEEIDFEVQTDAQGRPRT